MSTGRIVALMIMVAVLAAGLGVLTAWLISMASDSGDDDATQPSANLSLCVRIADPEMPDRITITDMPVIYHDDTCQPDVEDGMILLTDGDGTKRVPLTSLESRADATPEDSIWVPAYTSTDDRIVPLTGALLFASAEVQRSAFDQPIVFVEVRPSEQARFGGFTERHQNQLLAMFIGNEPLRSRDGKMIAPVVQGRIEDSLTITGLSEDDAKQIVEAINGAN